MVSADIGVEGSIALREKSGAVAKHFTDVKRPPLLGTKAAASGRHTVIVQLQMAPVAKAIAKTEANLSTRQVAHHRRVQTEQADFLAYCKSLDANKVNVLDQVQVVLNAVLLEVAPFATASNCSAPARQTHQSGTRLRDGSVRNRTLHRGGRHTGQWI